MNRFILLALFDANYEFDYDLNLTYKDKESKKIVSKKYSSSMYAVKEFDKKNFWSLDFQVNDGLNEETNKRMRTFYDSSIKLFYDIYQEEDECFRRSYRNSESINWYYFQDFLAKNSTMFNIGFHDYSYLGLYKIDGSDSLVFEMIISDFAMNEKNELTNGNSHSKNLNNISSNYVIATYYFDKGKSRFDKIGDLTIPFKIEFRLNENSRETELGKLTVDIKEYSYKNVKSEKIFDIFKTCIKKYNLTTNYDIVTIKYDTYSRGVRKTKNREKIKQGLKGALKQRLDYISPLSFKKKEKKLIAPF